MIGAAVVTYKKPKELAACLESRRGQIAPGYIIVQDTSEGENLLYTAGINKAIRTLLKEGNAGPPEFILVCCDDVTVRPSAVAEMSRYMEANPKCGIAAPIQVGRSGAVTCGGCRDAFPYGMHVVLPLDHEIYKEPFESYWANGACFLLRTSVITECGLMDENMKFICSDSDYSFTVRARGWKINMVPSAIVQHEPDGALNHKNAFIEETKDRDALYFINKWLSGGLFQQLAAEGQTLKVEQITNQLAILQYRLAEGYK